MVAMNAKPKKIRLDDLLVERGDFPDRATALARAREALAAIRIDGIKTNIALMIACLADPDIGAGRVSTGFIEQNRVALLKAADANATITAPA